jgi:hypothetical protein
VSREIPVKLAYKTHHRRQHSISAQPCTFSENGCNGINIS